MNPHQKNKVDISSLSQDEQRLFRLYGKLPNKKDLLQNKLKERKYFDSGDYALSKAGKASDTGITSMGTEHPSADTIPHMSPLTQQTSSQNTSSSTPSHDINNPTSNAPMLPGAGIHRGSINGIPGSGLVGATSRSPQKEGSFLARSESVDDGVVEAAKGKDAATVGEMGEAGVVMREAGGMSPPPKKEGIPIRR